MDVTFLAAANGTPLTKTFQITNDGEITGSSYPLVKHFTSFNERITSLKQFHDAVVTHAASGHCLLKGFIPDPLSNEPRAGRTSPTATTSWLCLDADGIEGVTTAGQLLKLLGLADVDHILQYSSSAGLNPDKQGLSAHIFLLLSEPATPEQLKLWLVHQNLHIAKLRAQLRLSRTAAALRWPLDRSVCQNDKLLFIAPPVLKGDLQSTLRGKRIQLITRSKRTASLRLDHDANALRIEEQKALNELRKKRGLEERSFRMRTYQGLEVISSPGPAQVTGHKEERGYVYLNLNGGDSWGYYHPIDNPQILYNFKGEPPYLTWELLPEYYAEAKKRAQQLTTEERKDRAKAQATAKREADQELLEQAKKDRQPESPETKTSGTTYLAFRDFNSDTYYNGSFNYATAELELRPTSSKQKLIDFALDHGLPAPEYIPDWRMVFDTTTPQQFIPEKKHINLFRPSPYWTSAKATRSPKLPQATGRLIQRVVGNDNVAAERLLNWLACIVQHKTYTGTAWVLHGTEGTGKGVLFHHVLAPMLGNELCAVTTMDRLKENYNGFLEHTLLVLVDEANFENYTTGGAIIEKLKNWIGEPTITVREIYGKPHKIPNHCNFILASNTRHAMRVPRGDRHYNIAPRQEQRWTPTDSEIEELHNERQAFMNYLVSRNADLQVARSSLENEAKQDMREITEDSPTEVVEALLNGDLRYFYDLLPMQTAAATDDLGVYFGQFIDQCFQACMQKEGRMSIHRDELASLFSYAIGWPRQSPSKFTKAAKRFGLNIKLIRKDEKIVRGIQVVWRFDKAILAEWGATRGKPRARHGR